MKNSNAVIVTIGDELLIGQVIDTNSSWMAQRLNEIGVAVKKRIAIGDSYTEICDMLDAECNNADLILITGGLGPTSDDITKQALCAYFGGAMIINGPALENVKYLFEKVYHKPVSKINLSQAEVPDVCEVIQNKRGSAPGMVFKNGSTTIISMPGVPYEMQGIMNEVIPYIQKNFTLPAIIHRTILTAGIGESAIAEILTQFEVHLPEGIRLAYLPQYGMVRLRLSATGFDKVGVAKLIDDEFEKLKSLVEKFMVVDKDEPLEKVIGQLLLKNKKSISTAESCTGGAIARLIASVPGASAYYEGSIISYSYEVKMNLLGVKSSTLQYFGAVSEETVREMLHGILRHLKTDYGIAVSGIMGPEGGLPGKPVGTVWIAVGNKENCVAQKIQLRFERHKNIEVTTLKALDMMRHFIIDNLI